MPSKSKVCFFFERKDFSLTNRAKLKDFIERIFKKEGLKMASLNYIFSSDSRILEINRQFLKHNYYTDIITFNMSESGPAQGEVYISIDRIRENAKKLGISFTSELHRVIIHAVLHLCGYKDKTQREIKAMRQKEDFYLDSYFSK
jgi:probable rRNA maturation factor